MHPTTRGPTRRRPPSPSPPTDPTQASAVTPLSSPSPDASRPSECVRPATIPKTCQICGKKHDGSYRFGRFCSQACAACAKEGQDAVRRAGPSHPSEPSVNVQLADQDLSKFYVDRRLDAPRVTAQNFKDMDAPVNKEHRLPVEAKPNQMTITATAAMVAQLPLTTAEKHPPQRGPPVVEENLLAELQRQNKERKNASTTPGAPIAPLPVAMDLCPRVHDTIEPAPKAPMNANKESENASTKHGAPIAPVPVAMDLCPRVHETIEPAPKAPMNANKEKDNATTKPGAPIAPVPRNRPVAMDLCPRVHDTIVPAPKAPMNASIPLSPVPKAKVVFVSSLPRLSAAVLALSSCNVFGFDTTTQPCPTDNRYLKSSPLYFQIAGARLRHLPPGPKAFSADEIRTSGSNSEVTYILDLPALLPKHGRVLTNFLAPILDDPHRIIVGVGVLDHLRALTCGYAKCVPCLYGVVWGVQDIGKLVGKSERWDLERLSAHILGVRLEDKLRSSKMGLQPWSVDWQYAANGARLAVMVYVSAGSKVFESTERRVELEKMPAWKCKMCGEERLLQKRAPDQCLRRGCQRKWDKIPAGKKEDDSILSAVRVCVGGWEKEKWNREDAEKVATRIKKTTPKKEVDQVQQNWAKSRKEADKEKQGWGKSKKEADPVQRNWDAMLEERRLVNADAKRTAPEAAEGADTSVTKRARTEKNKADEVIDLTKL